MPMRDKTQADFDLERFVDMFDEAMTSQDPRVIETLRNLMMIVTMTRPEDRYHSIDRRTGPLRQMYDDVRQAHRRLSDVEDTLRTMEQSHLYSAKNQVQSHEQSKYNVGVIAQTVEYNAPQSSTSGISGGGAKTARKDAAAKWNTIAPLTLQNTK